MHFLQIEVPHGKVTGSIRGYEHSGHCISLTICLASFEASSAALWSSGSVLEEFGIFEDGDLKRRGAFSSGREDI